MLDPPYTVCSAMKILGKGRPLFLEFLRNLTPQILLLAFGLTLWVRLDFHHFDFRNWFNTVVFYACALTFLLAISANIIQFIEGYAGVAFESVDARMAKARRRVDGYGLRLCFLYRTVKREKWSILANVGLTLIIIEVGVLAAGWVVTRQAIQMLKVVS